MDAVTEHEIREVLTKEMNHGIFHCNMRSIIVERVMAGIQEALDRNLSRQIKAIPRNESSWERHGDYDG